MVVIDSSKPTLNNRFCMSSNTPASIQTWLPNVLLDYTSDLISVWDKCASLVFATPSHTAYFSELLPRQLDHLLLIVHPDERETLRERIQESLFLKKSSKLVYRLLGPNGAYHCFESTLNPVIAEDDNTCYLVLVSRDVTETRTSLPNRAFFEERVQEAIVKEEPFSLLMVDIDRLNMINDNLGHHYGDLLLRQFSKKLRDMLNCTDFVTRLDSDVFGIILKKHPSNEDIHSFVSRLFDLLQLPFIIEHHELSIHVSVGISRYPADGLDKCQLLKNASIAVNKAKESRENSSQIYSRQLEVDSLNTFTLEKDLRKAIDEKQFELVYQPLVKARSNEVIGVEALIRWNHPVRGLISPIEFIPLSEDAGLIKPISDWVLRKACLDMKNIMESQKKQLTLAVNISARQFHSNNFVENIRNLVDEVGFPKEHLKLEITESALMENSEATTKILKELQQLGIQIYIDDFGTGYSSLGYLKRFPIDGLKIDRSFLNDCLSTDKDEEIIKAIINLAHILKLTVVAEGVETAEQLHLLKKNECDIFQGYLFSKPQPIHLIRELLKE